MSERVFVTGFGIISSIGNNVAENFQSLVNRKSGFGRIEILETIHRDTLPACEIKFQDDELQELAEVKTGEGFTRTTLLALMATKEAIQSAGLSQNEVRESGLLSSTTTGGIRELEKYYFESRNNSQYRQFLEFPDIAHAGDHTERIADSLQIKKYIGTLSTACSSSANAIMLGAQLIKNNVVERVICGGAEALSKFTINGFNSLMILDSEHCRPFDATRKGLNLGEGAAYLVLEAEPSVTRSRKKPLAELKGYGNANDAFHQTASSPDGAGAFRAMQLAIEMSGLSVSEIDYINAHGTATANNDLSEVLAMQKLFGNHVPSFSSTKPYTGHTLAAAGSMEAAFCILALQHRMIFPNLNFKEKMPEVELVPETRLRKQVGLRNVLSNSFGFGGNTSSLLLSAC